MGRKKPVTEVTDASDVANLRWYEQGDASLQTAAALEARAALRRDRVVLQELNAWWNAALNGSFPAARAAAAEGGADSDDPAASHSIDKSRYCAIKFIKRPRAPRGRRAKGLGGG